MESLINAFPRPVECYGGPNRQSVAPYRKIQLQLLQIYWEHNPDYAYIYRMPEFNFFYYFNTEVLEEISQNLDFFSRNPSKQERRNMTTTVPEAVMLDLEMKISGLEQSLLAKDPQMPVHLKNIHQLLLEYKDAAALLTADQLGAIISSQSEMLGIHIVKQTAKKAVAASRKKPSLDEM